MAKYPEIQTKAQEEIDRVIGNSRLPSMSDQANLPYVNALISEILRCSTIAPTGMAHKLRVNDVYKGYLLPKGTYIVSNLWYVPKISASPSHSLIYDSGICPEITAITKTLKYSILHVFYQTFRS
jgi:hypothetical protein